jgi:electron transfer flavoprotein alpha subunit/NAD-dependent dihydropyrimidine dehydrogenase PreA subunit
MTVWIETELCNGCRRCVKVCPYGAIEIQEGHAKILDRCTSCGACVSVCKQGAIHNDAVPREIPDFSDRKGIWVVAEQRGGELMRVSFELLGKAAELAEKLDEEVCAVLVGWKTSRLAKELMRYGAAKVYSADHRLLESYRNDAYTKVVCEFVEDYRPNIVLIGATVLGRDLAPRISRRVGAGLTADCTDLGIDDEEKILLQTRPAFGGNVMATIANRFSRPQMATVRPGVMKPGAPKKGSGDVILWKGALKERDIRTKILEQVREKRKSARLDEAKVIVAGGRGVGSEKGWGKIFELAEALGGEVAGTRIVVENGWLSAERQVGQTGQSVRPELYIACGLSGAIQHRAGMAESRYIVAINKDARAPIFQVADWGIVADLHDVVPALINGLNARG